MILRITKHFIKHFVFYIVSVATYLYLYWFATDVIDSEITEIGIRQYTRLSNLTLDLGMASSDRTYFIVIGFILLNSLLYLLYRLFMGKYPLKKTYFLVYLLIVALVSLALG